MDSASPPPRQSGFVAGLSAYFIWGFLPLYLILVREVPPFEFVGWRIIWTLPICLVIVAVRRQGPEIMRALRQRRTLVTLLASSTLIGVNWLVYVWAIQNGQVYAASLGYYINPLINVLLGTFVLGERLTGRQWAAVAIAAAGVALLLGGAITTLWISLTLGLSFGTYGLLRKRVDVGALPGLTIESALLLVPAVAIAWWYAASAAGSAFFQSVELSLAIVLGGVVTAVPLLLFAIAARRMDYSTLGFLQFLAPTIVFILGLTVFDQPLRPVQVACFVLIWTAIAVFVWDILVRRKADKVLQA
ncbi:EamA family transporter RarD [Altererythrobacter marinus]|uniref:EamA family transporter RarD n=1 Tax=Pelagerythrobacter marinus TaxID=538382 RepID=A0ABW9UVL6_9SPHN|nr:EamA family transporter RarD [Pelagerythrobacter marinus]MXO67625.1 EamA family transporter RarD [Pelagerythrobacter marinus]